MEIDPTVLVTGATTLMGAVYAAIKVLSHTSETCVAHFDNPKRRVKSVDITSSACPCPILAKSMEEMMELTKSTTHHLSAVAATLDRMASSVATMGGEVTALHNAQQRAEIERDLRRQIDLERSS